ELDPFRGKRVRGGQAIAHVLGLGERKRAAARADDERRGLGRGRRRGLHPMTSQCYAGRSRPKQRSPDGAAAKSGLSAPRLPALRVVSCATFLAAVSVCSPPPCGGGLGVGVVV